MLVGRDRELEELVQRLEQGSRVVVLGEAGIGKTTLVRAAAGEAGVGLREGGALSTLSWMPYLPFERAFRRKFEHGDAAYVAAEIEHLLRSDTLFLDDLQWADGASQALLPMFAEETRVVVAVRRGDPGTPAALEIAASMGAEILSLAPLAEPDATAFVSRRRPDLSPAGVRQVVRRAGGNPLLLEELPGSGEATESLRLSIAARLAHLPPDARASLGLLALAGRPLPRAFLRGPGDDLVDAGLAVRDRRGLTVRHALLAEAAAAALTEDERIALHLQLARRSRDPGESARHYAAGGDAARAHASAMRAAGRAVTPGERADHLALAAACAKGADADALVVGAAQALLEAGRHTAAAAALERFADADGEAAAEAALLRWRALQAVGDLEGARRAWETGLALVGNAPLDVRVRLRVEQAAVTLTLDRDPELALVQARAGMRLASAHGGHLTTARYLRGRAAFAAGEPGWERDLRRSLDEARRVGDHELAQAAGGLLAFALLISGRLRKARTITEALVAEARALRLTGPERRLRARLAGIDWNAGRSQRTVEACDALLDERLEPAEAFMVRFFLAQALTDQAKYARARTVLDELRAMAPDDRGSLEHVLWVESDVELWSGRPEQALAAADRCLAGRALPSEGPHVFVRLTRGWACLELGLHPGEPTLRPAYGMGEGASYEEQALVALVAGEHGRAADLFHRAAALWRRRQARGEVRCLFGRGEALRLGGDRDQARRALEAAERVAERQECHAVLARIRRSLRLVGGRRAAARTRGPGGLTGREAEVMRLVADGLTNAEIARRLALGRPTVEQVVNSASRKLGARTRLQAAALAAEE